MALPAKKLVWKSVPLKVISLMLGYTFWYVFSNSHTTTLWVAVPITFYNIPHQYKLRAPESLSIKIAGKRSEIRALDFEQLALHINAEQLHKGKNILTLQEDQLFLPNTIKLLHYSPSNPTIELVTEA